MGFFSAIKIILNSIRKDFSTYWGPLLAGPIVYIGLGYGKETNGVILRFAVLFGVALWGMIAFSFGFSLAKSFKAITAFLILFFVSVLFFLGAAFAISAYQSAAMPMNWAPREFFVLIFLACFLSLFFAAIGAMGHSLARERR